MTIKSKMINLAWVISIFVSWQLIDTASPAFSQSSSSIYAMKPATIVKPDLRRANVGDYINTPYTTVPDYYITDSELASNNWGPAMDRAFSSLKNTGGGKVLLLPHVYHIANQDISVPVGTALEGVSHVSGAVPGLDYRNLPYTISVDPGYTVRMSANASIKKVVLIPSNLTKPASYDEEVASLSQWHSNGTAISIDGSGETLAQEVGDVELSDLFIIGFNQAIHSDYAERLRISDIYGDNQNGLSINNCHDVCRVRDVHWNSFFNYQSSLGGINFPITSIDNNGSGGVRLTLQTQTDVIKTGYVLTLWSDYTNSTGLNGKYTVTVVDSTHVDLQGVSFKSTYHGSSASPVVTTLYLDTSSRDGVAFYITNTEDINIYGSFAFGYHIGYDFGDGAVWPFVMNSSVDAYLPPHDPDRIGVLVSGTSDRLQWTGGYISSTYDPFLFMGSSKLAAHTVMNVSLGATFNSCLNIQSGIVQVIGSTCVGGAPIYTGLNIGGVVSFVGDQLNNSKIMNTSTAFTPVVVDTTTGTVTGMTMVPLRVSKISNLPQCTTDSQLGIHVYVNDMLKPSETTGGGSGGNAVCATDGKGGYAWYSEFSGTLASE